MKNEITILKIKCDGEVLDTFLLRNPQGCKITELQNILDSRYDENGDYNKDFDYGYIYEYLYKNFEIVGYEEEDFEF